jgi:hypothetical protein
MNANGKRRDNGKATRFKAGHAGGPGRPPGSKSLASMILEQTRNGAELVEIMVGIAREESASNKDKIAAVAWLADRGLGKVAQPIEGTADDGAIVVRWRNPSEAVP